MWSQKTTLVFGNHGRQDHVRTSGTALVGSVPSFSCLKSYTGEVPELGIDLKRSESMNAPEGQHQTVIHLLLTYHDHSILSFHAFIELFDLDALRYSPVISRYYPDV